MGLAANLIAADLFCYLRVGCSARRGFEYTSIGVLVIVTRSDPSSVTGSERYRVGIRLNPSAKLICADLLTTDAQISSQTHQGGLTAFSLCRLPKISD